MCQSRKPLLALVDQEFRPIDESLIDLLERFGVVLRQLYALPKLGRHMCAFDGLHVEIECASLGVGADSGISRIGERAGLSVA